MTYCSHCGKEIPADSAYCPFCGVHVPEVVNKTSEAVKTERVVTEPVRVEKVVTEKETKPVVTNIYKGESGTHKQIEFFLNPGFWGSLLVLVGFFLPFFTLNNISLFSAVTQTANTEPAVLIWLVFPVSAIIILIQSLVHPFAGFIIVLFKVLTLVALILFGYVIFNNPEKYFGTTDMSNLFKIIGLGFWFTFIGAIIMLFSNNYRRVTRRIDRVDRVDERL